MSENSTEDPAVTISFTTNTAEQARAARQVFRTTWAWWLAMGVFVALPLALGALIATRVGVLDRRAITMLFLAVGSALFWHFGLSWINVASARRAIPAANGPYTWALNADGCSLIAPNSTTTLRWTAIIRVRETSDFLLLYVGRNIAHFIPKRAVLPEDWSRVRAMLTRIGARS